MVGSKDHKNLKDTESGDESSEGEGEDFIVERVVKKKVSGGVVSAHKKVKNMCHK